MRRRIASLLITRFVVRHDGSRWVMEASRLTAREALLSYASLAATVVILGYVMECR